MVKLQFTTSKKSTASTLIKMPSMQLGASSSSNANIDTLLGPIQDFVNNIYSNQQALLDKIDNLEDKVDNLDKIRILIFSNEENTDQAVSFFIEVMSKFDDFYVEHVYVNADTIVDEFMKGYKKGVQAFILNTYSSRLGVLNDYLNNNPELIVSDRMIISTSSTAPEFRLVKNGELTAIPRNKNILRMITNDKLQISSFVTLASESDFLNKHNFVIYENDAYGIPFYNSFKQLNENNNGSSFSFYTTEQMGDMITDIVVKNDKPVHVYSILFSSNAGKLLDSLAVFDSADSSELVKHVEKITNAEDYDFRKLNEEQYKVALKHGLSFYTYNGSNTDTISRLEKISDANISWSLNSLLSFDCALLANKVFNSASKETNATKRALAESRTLYGLTGFLQIDNDTSDRYFDVSDIEFMKLLKGSFNKLENPYVSTLRIKNSSDVTIPEKGDNVNEFDFGNYEYLYITNNGVLQITKELVESFNAEDGVIEFNNQVNAVVSSSSGSSSSDSSSSGSSSSGSSSSDSSSSGSSSSDSSSSGSSSSGSSSSGSSSSGSSSSGSSSSGSSSSNVVYSSILNSMGIGRIGIVSKNMSVFNSPQAAAASSSSGSSSSGSSSSGSSSSGSSSSGSSSSGSSSSGSSSSGSSSSGSSSSGSSSSGSSSSGSSSFSSTYRTKSNAMSNRFSQMGSRYVRTRNLT